MSDFIVNVLNSLEGNKFWNKYHDFCDNLYKEEVDEDELLILLPKVFKKLENDMASFQMYNAISKFSEFQINKAENIYYKILGLNDEKLLTLIPDILKGLSKSKESIDIIKEIKFLVDNQNIGLQRQGYYSILSFEKEDLSENKKFIEYLDVKITMNLKSTDTTFLNVITKVVGKFQLIIPNANQKLISLSEVAIPEVQYEIANLLHKEIKIAEETELFKILLFSLHKTEPQYLGIINILNHFVLPDLIEKNSDLLHSFFDKWLLFNDSRYKEIILFEDVFINIYKNNNSFFKKIITSWLYSDNSVFHKAINKLLLKISIQDINSIELCEEYLLNLNSKDIKFIATKIIGYIYFKEQLRSVLYSILQAKIDDTESVKFIKAMFNEYVVFNYPSTLEYFKEIKKTAPKKVKPVITEMEKVNTKYFDSINNLNLINEFNPSDKRLNLYNNIHRKDFESLQKENDKNDTSFLSMVKRIQLRTGKGMFSKHQGNYTEKTEMTAFQYSAELPRGEYISTLEQEKIRALYRIAKREV